LYKVVFTVVEVPEPAFSAIMPLTSAMCRDVTEPWDYVGEIRYFSCPDVERPVVFKVERVPVRQGEVPLR